MIERAVCEAVFREAVAACEPAVRVREAMARIGMERPTIAIAIGKAARAMARGAGEVGRGIVVCPGDGDGDDVPDGWRVIVAAHPVPDERSVAAGAAVLALIRAARPEDRVLALISGGASALVEQPLIPLARFNAEIAEVVASGATIHEINRARIARSAIKGGKLAALCAAPIVTLAFSDVIGDDITIIGSGPTIAPTSHAEVIAPMASFGIAVHAALAARGITARWIAEPMRDDVVSVADRLVAERGAIVAWGEPTVALPRDHGRGGRAQQLALELAKRLRGTARCAFVAGSDGIDGPPPAAAGAYVDGTSWDAMRDPDAALAHCDAASALSSIAALFTPGPTGINYADIVIVA